ncbi:MAG: OmpA family protein [Kiritimatiellae bacterium]|nr:OmpA family protein [Kiritimatiellia bacterium]
MKISTCMTAAAFTLAIAASGCRYSKSDADGADDVLAAGENAGEDISADAGDFETDTLGPVSADSEGGSLSDLANAASDGAAPGEWPGYARCADVEFEPVFFALDATAVAPAELVKIEEVARHLGDNPDRVVTVEGNCDERGSNEYNLSLGEDRATIIANFLAQNGVSRNRIKTVSRGESNPAVEGTGEAAWSKNRRGEFIIWKK